MEKSQILRCGCFGSVSPPTLRANSQTVALPLGYANISQLPINERPKLLVLNQLAHEILRLLSFQLLINEVLGLLFVKDRSAAAAELVAGRIIQAARGALLKSEPVVRLGFFLNLNIVETEQGVVQVAAREVHVRRGHVRALDPAEVLFHLRLG